MTHSLNFCLTRSIFDLDTLVNSILESCCVMVEPPPADVPVKAPKIALPRDFASIAE